MDNSTLLHKRCIPCEGGVSPASDEAISGLLPQVPEWVVLEIEKNGVRMKTLQRQMVFSDFSAAMAFLRKVENLAESEGHHPDFCVRYNKVDFTLYTHAIRGLHENDFILAAKIDQLRS